jgi:XTP/dITP diphosphohydrolase
LLAALEGVPRERRRARFVCWAALVSPKGAEHTAEGVIDGTILEQPRGPGGFGYDPVFVPEGMDRTMSELSEEEKNAMSHRTRALRKLIPYL